MTARFITVHLLHALPLHNLNRDQNGLPKTAFDGGVQRGRLSSQSLKRAARVALRNGGFDLSVRTRLGAEQVLEAAKAYSAANDLALDDKAAAKEAAFIVRGLTNKDAKKDPDPKGATKEPDPKDGDNVILLARSEITALGKAVVDAQHGGQAATEDDLVADCRSAALDVAAFGRMFAKAQTKGTQAAVAVSHAITCHPIQFTVDYFSAVDDVKVDDSGAAHIGMAYYTSGVYYHSFTVDVEQLRRSWTMFGQDGWREQMAALVKALITALPSGKYTNTAAHTLPFIVLAEAQHLRVNYGFDAPVQSGPEGGYALTSALALAQQREIALTFDPTNFGESIAYVAGTVAVDLKSPSADSIDDVVKFVVHATHEA